MKNLSCSFFDTELNRRCGEPAISAILLVSNDECGYVCEKHVDHVLISSAIEKGKAKRISLEEAVTHEVMTS